MWRSAFLLLALVGCKGGGNGPDEAAIHARMEQLGQSAGRDDTVSWDYHSVQRGAGHDANAAEALAGGIPRGMTVWPVRVSATYHVNSRASAVTRDFLFYRTSDGKWVGVNATNGTSDRPR